MLIRSFDFVESSCRTGERQETFQPKQLLVSLLVTELEFIALFDQHTGNTCMLQGVTVSAFP